MITASPGRSASIASMSEASVSENTTDGWGFARTGEGVDRVLGREGREAAYCLGQCTRVKVNDILGVHVLVGTTDVLVQVLADRRELAAAHADHAERTDLQNVGYGDTGEILRGEATLPRRRMSNRESATTPIYTYKSVGVSLEQCRSRTFLSDLDAPDPVHPVVYSP
jgi:hypothetical protein